MSDEMHDATPFHVTTTVDGKVTEFRKPIDDPFIRQTVTVEKRLASWIRWPCIRTTVEVNVGGDLDAINAVMRTINAYSDADVIRGAERVTGETYRGGGEWTK